MDHVRYLLRLVELELIDRERRLIERRIKAARFTICQSCRLIGVDVRAYLVDTFAELHAGCTDYANLRPAAWAARRDSSAKSG